MARDQLHVRATNMQRTTLTHVHDIDFGRLVGFERGVREKHLTGLMVLWFCGLMFGFVVWLFGDRELNPVSS